MSVTTLKVKQPTHQQILQRSLTGTFNVGYGESITVLDLAQRIIRLAESSSQITHQPERPGDVRHSRASAAKLAATGFHPISSLDQGLTETLGSLMNHTK